jgi:hypothetical protein
MDLTRIQRLSGIREARLEDDLDDERHDRERKIVKLLAMAFQRIDLPVAEDGIFYDEENSREAIISLDEDRLDLQRLDKLHKTGLANSYLVWGTRDGLSVMFSVLPDLDNAVIQGSR